MHKEVNNNQKTYNRPMVITHTTLRFETLISGSSGSGCNGGTGGGGGKSYP